MRILVGIPVFTGMTEVYAEMTEVYAGMTTTMGITK